MRIYLTRAMIIFFFAVAVLTLLSSPAAAQKGKIPEKKIDAPGREVLVGKANVPYVVASNAMKFPPTTPAPKVLPKHWPIHPAPKYVKNPPGFCVPTWRCGPVSPTKPKPGKGPKYSKGPHHGKDPKHFKGPDTKHVKGPGPGKG